MKRLQRQLVLNKAEDWRAAYCWGVVPEGDGLTLAPGARRGVICLWGLDSGETGFYWGRASLDCRLAQDSLIRTRAYAADVAPYGDYATLEAYLASLAPGAPEAEEALEALFTPVGEGEDFYIDQNGRYLWLMLEFFASGPAPGLEALRLHMAGDHMVDYLPAIYRENGDFTKRFLSIFDSIMMDMEQAIYDLPARFDYENTSGPMLEYLADWMCVGAEEGGGETLADRIRTAQADYESLYTVAGIKRSVRRLTGQTPLLIESADVDPNRPDCANSALYRRLYGENPYQFFILLPEDAFHSRAQMEAFLERMQRLIPAGTEFELVLLKRCVQLDRHTYLGVNTMVSDYVPAVIDENTTIHYDTMIGGNEVEGR